MDTNNKVTAYVNGTLIGSVTYAGDQAGFRNVSFLRMSQTADTMEYRADNLTFYNGTAYPADSTTPDTSPISINKSLNNTVPIFSNSVNASFNVSTTSGTLSTGMVVINQSGFKEYYNFTLSGTWDTFSQNFTVSCNGGCVINVSAVVNNTDPFNFTTSTLLLVAATSPPGLTLNPTNFFNTSNNSLIKLNDSNRVLLNLSFTDDIDLFGFEFNITNSSGGVVLNFSNTSLSGLTANFAAWINVSAPPGFYNVSITSWDSHTLNKIPDYKINDGFGSTISFDNIIITADSSYYTNSHKSLDRYSFEFSYFPFNNPKTKIFYIESDNELEYRATSNYKGHFVDWKNKKWIDFEGIDGTPEISQLSKTKWSITFSNNLDSKVTFHSIGGLNSITTNFNYYIVNPVRVFAKDIFSNATITGFNVTATGSTTGTVYTARDEGSGSANLSLYTSDTQYNLAIVASNYNASDVDTAISTTTNNYTFYLYKKNSVYVRIFTEGTSTLLTPNSIKGAFDSSSYVFNQSTTNGTLYAEDLLADTYTLTLSSSGYTTRNYDFILDGNNSVQIDAYLVNSTGLTAVTFVVKDQTTTQTIEGATVSVYDKIGTTYVLIDQQSTNVIGEIVSSLDTTKTYRIIVSKSGYTTDTSDFTYTSATSYTINLLSTSAALAESLAIGIKNDFTPHNPSLVNGTTYTFSFDMTSTNWNITNCVMTLKNSTTNFIQSNTSFSSSACNIDITTGTGHNGTIISSVTYTLNNTHNNTVSVQYSIKYYYQGRFSLKTVIDDINNFSGAAFNDWTRMFIGFLIIFAIIGYVAKKASFVDPDYLIILFMILTFAISYLGWFKLNYDAIPAISWMDAELIRKYVISLIIFLTGTGIIASRNMG